MMADFIALVHFRALPGSEAALDRFLGGYGWVLGRCPSEESFRTEVHKHLDEAGFVVVDWEDLQEIVESSILNEEQAQLHAMLDVYPIQYRTFHLYRADDA